MVATGARVRALASLLADAGWTQVTPPRLQRLADLPPAQQERIRALYNLLGGHPDHFARIRPGGWDLAFDTPGGLLLVELDEEQHFNRYRAQTLTATESLDTPWTPDYLNYCKQYEHRLLPGWGTGQRWTNPSAALFFGQPSAPGDFGGAGAPRWRQRAFYDAVKDIMTNRRLARVSAHDALSDLPGGPALDVLLRRPEPDVAPAIANLVARRTHEA